MYNLITLSIAQNIELVVEGCEAPRAYVTSMGTGRVYSVDLVDGTSTLMKFTQKALNDQDLMPPPPPSTKGPVERTFVDDMTRMEDPTQLETFEPFLIKVQRRHIKLRNLHQNEC